MICKTFLQMVTHHQISVQRGEGGCLHTRGGRGGGAPAQQPAHQVYHEPALRPLLVQRLGRRATQQQAGEENYSHNSEIWPPKPTLSSATVQRILYGRLTGVPAIQAILKFDIFNTE